MNDVSVSMASMKAIKLFPVKGGRWPRIGRSWRSLVMSATFGRGAVTADISFCSL
jgi:hypothetical protein